MARAKSSGKDPAKPKAGGRSATAGKAGGKAKAGGTAAAGQKGSKAKGGGTAAAGKGGRKAKAPTEAKAPERRSRKAGEDPARDTLDLATIMQVLGNLDGVEGPEDLDELADIDPRDEALDLIESARHSDDPGERESLAFTALSLWGDCADAYTLLSVNSAPSWEERMAFAVLAAAAGERALADAASEMDGEPPMDAPEVRSYLEARFAMAYALYDGDEPEAATAHVQALLELDPDDALSARYLLVPALIRLDRDDEAQTLQGRFPEDTSYFRFARALLAFRAEGDTPATREALASAVTLNRHVVPYLTGRTPMPDDIPSPTWVGGEEEAVHCVYLAQPAWEHTPGALDWLRKHAGEGRGRK